MSTKDKSGLSLTNRVPSIFGSIPESRPSSSRVLSPSPVYIQAGAHRQEVIQHHHHRQAMARQVLDPLNHGSEGHVQPWGLLPGSLLGHRGLSRQHQVAVDISPTTTQFSLQ
jgi:hypothetical protein